MKEFWNERYEQEEYLYGRTPNLFFAEQLVKLKKGKLLLPAEGEGRNAVFAARNGWEVTAFDYSEAGKEKAIKLADLNKVDFDYEISEASKFSTEDKFDAIALIYAHFEGRERDILFKKLENALIPHGQLIIEVYSKNQLGRNTGGPKKLELLYSKDEIAALFPNIEFHMLEETLVELDEGEFHKGEGSVIRALGVKKD